MRVILSFLRRWYKNGWVFRGLILGLAIIWNIQRLQFHKMQYALPADDNQNQPHHQDSFHPENTNRLPFHSKMKLMSNEESTVSTLSSSSSSSSSTSSQLVLNQYRQQTTINHPSQRLLFLLAIESKEEEEEEEEARQLRLVTRRILSEFHHYYPIFLDKDKQEKNQQLLQNQQQQQRRRRICRLQDVLFVGTTNTKETNIADCGAAYTFVRSINMRQAIQNKDAANFSKKNDEDDDVIDIQSDGNHNGTIASVPYWWVSATQDLLVRVTSRTNIYPSFAFLALTGSGTILFPTEFQNLWDEVVITHSLSLPPHGRNNTTEIFGSTTIQTTNSSMDGHTTQFAPGTFHGRLSVMSMNLASYISQEAATKKGQSSDTNNNQGPFVNSNEEGKNLPLNFDTILSPERRQGIDLRVADVDPKIQATNASDMNQWWESYKKGVTGWNLLLQSQQNRTIRYVTGKFGRLPRQFVEQVRRTRSYLLAHGLAGYQISAYDKFPHFIKSDPRWKRHLEFTWNETAPDRGGGYWFWKAPLILHELDRVKMDDFVIYADVDLWEHVVWLPDLITDMIQTNSTVALFRQNTRNRKWSKRDVYERYCNDRDSNPERDPSNQYAGGFVVLQKRPGTIRLIQRWESGMADYGLLNDSPSITGLSFLGRCLLTDIRS